MPAVPEHAPEPTQRRAVWSGPSEDKGIGRDYRDNRAKGPYRNYDEDTELMMAIWNGVDNVDTVSIQMCMDEAGRWRIAWGQLVD